MAIQNGPEKYNLSLSWEGGSSISGNNIDNTDPTQNQFGGYLPMDGISIGSDENIRLDSIYLSIDQSVESVMTFSAEFYGLTVQIGPVTAVEMAWG